MTLSKKSIYFFKFVLLLAGVTFMLTTCTQPKPTPPVAKKIPKADTLFDDVRIDNYYLLRNRKDPEVLKYLKAENAYTEAVMKHTEKLQQKLFTEMKSRIKETDLSVPYRIDNYYYYTRTEQGKQYKIHCRKKGGLDAKEEVLLDENELAKGYGFFALGAFSVSPDQKLLAYSVDTTGSETFTLYVKDLENGSLLPDQISGIYYPVEWANDNHTLFYTTLDSTKRPYRLYRHVLKSESKNYELVYQEEDLAFYLNLRKSRSRKYLFLSLESEITSEVRFLNADRPGGKFKMIQPRQFQLEYSVAHHGNEFYIVTNDHARNFKVVKTPVTRPQKKYWKDFIPHSNEVKIDGVGAFLNHLAIYQRENGLKTIRLFNFHSGKFKRIDFPEPVYAVWANKNPEYNSNILRFTYMSLVTPKSVYDYNMDDGTRELKKQDEVLGGYNPGEYRSERIFATAKDGTKVPISLVYRKGIAHNGKNPLFLTGYGAYGASKDPYFSSNRLSLLNRGFIFAIAHVRGGGEMGRFWYEDGKLLKKKNSFTDFISCAEELISRKYTSPEKLVISGGSAGGLLIGAVTNMHPELFHVVVAHVPFVDVLNTMLDESIPLTVIEYDEWGNPHKKEFYDYIKSYAPYEKVAAKTYPNMLVTAGLNDPRVGYWEPAKWVAKLRAIKTDQNLLLLKTKMGAGHMGASGRYDYLKDIAFEYAFIFDRLGIKD